MRSGTVRDPGVAASAAASRGRRRRATLLALTAIMLIGFSGATARLFIWPRVDRPAPADAIVVFVGRGDAFDTGIRLARRGLAPVLAVSVDTHFPSWCNTFEIPHVVLVCFSPQPETTQGESRATAALAARHHWGRVILVAIRPQVTRAGLRLRRCYSGGIQVVAAPVRVRQLPYRVLYEWGAMLKALTVQRSC